MQENGIKWFPFFSRTGSEIADNIEEIRHCAIFKI